MKQNIFALLKNSFKLFFSGKIKFDSSIKGKKLVMHDGKIFIAFRKVEISNNKSAKVYFIVRFKPKKMPTKINIYFSLLPMWIMLGFSGFKSKIRGVDYETGLFQGLYQRESYESASIYSQSIAMDFMSKRSFPDSIYTEIISMDNFCPFEII